MRWLIQIDKPSSYRNWLDNGHLESNDQNLWMALGLVT